MTIDDDDDFIRQQNEVDGHLNKSTRNYIGESNDKP